MRQHLWVGVCLIVLVMAGLSTGAYALYQHHLSGDVKRLLIAANDEHSNLGELREYIAQARPLVRTKRDRDVLGEFEEGMALFVSVQDDEQEDNRVSDVMSRSSQGEQDECDRALYKDVRTRNQYREMGQKPPEDLQEQIELDKHRADRCIDERAENYIQREAREDRNRALSIQHLNNVRHALGLPSIRPQ